MLAPWKESYDKPSLHAFSGTSVVSGSLRPHGPRPTRLLCPGDSPHENTGVGCHAFLQGIILTQGLNPYLLSVLHYRQIIYRRAPREAHEKPAAAKSLQSSPNLCDPRDSSPPGSPVPGILQARTLEWITISFSNAWKWKVKMKSLSHVRLLATPWTAAYQPPPSMGFSRQEYWSGVPLPSPMTNLDTILKSRAITLLTKVCRVKTMVSPVVMYRCVS